MFGFHTNTIHKSMKIICLLTEKDATLFYKKVALLNQQNDIIVLKSLKEIFRCNFKKAKTEFYQIEIGRASCRERV